MVIADCGQSADMELWLNHQSESATFAYGVSRALGDYPC